MKKIPHHPLKEQNLLQVLFCYHPVFSEGQFEQHEEAAHAEFIQTFSPLPL
jgi:hypothetical protein